MRGKALRKILWVLFSVCFLCVVGTMLFLSLRYRLTPESYTKPVREVTGIGGTIAGREETEVTLPTTFDHLPARTSVILTAAVNVNGKESLMISSFFAPLKLYFNDVLVYEYGQEGSYPSFMNDPPCLYTMVPLPQSGNTVEIRAEFLSLTQRNALTIPAMLIGEEAALMAQLTRQEGPTFLFSLLLIFMGAFLILVALTFANKAPANLPFFWLGLFSVAPGCWFLGESSLTAFIIPYPVLLYLFDYIGLFSFSLPLILFVLSTLKPKNKTPLHALLLLHTLALLAVLLLQIFGLADFTRTLYLFHVTAPLALLVLAGDLIWEYIKHRNPAALRFAPAMTLLAAAAVLEALNYWFHFIPHLTVFFQLGVLVFVILLSVASGFYMQESIQAIAENRRLAFEMAAINRSLELQRIQYRQIAEDDSKVKTQRHDLRHQLAAMRGMSGNAEKLEDYIDTLLKKIPPDFTTNFCDNYALNAVAAYYYALAKERGVKANINLVVPEGIGSALESDLCVVVGNLLENAVEACDRAGNEKTFLRLNSILHGAFLVITLDNTCHDVPQAEGGHFLSSKREGGGMGLASVKAVAEKYGGNAKFEAKDGVFMSSLFLNVV